MLSQGVSLKDVYSHHAVLHGGAFVNYFNRFGRQWRVYVQAGEYRAKAENLRQFYVFEQREQHGPPLAALTTLRNTNGPEFTMRYNLYEGPRSMRPARRDTVPPRP